MWASGAESSQEFERGSRLRQGWESLAFRWGRGRIPPGDSLTRSRSENCSQTTHFCICVWDNMILCMMFINKHGCTKEMLNFLKFLMVCSGNVCNRCYVFPDWAKNICLSAIIFQCELRQNFTPRLIMNLKEPRQPNWCPGCSIGRGCWQWGQEGLNSAAWGSGWCPGWIRHLERKHVPWCFVAVQHADQYGPVGRFPGLNFCS